MEKSGLERNCYVWDRRCRQSQDVRPRWLPVFYGLSVAAYAGNQLNATLWPAGRRAAGAEVLYLYHIEVPLTPRLHTPPVFIPLPSVSAYSLNVGSLEVV